MLRDVLDLPQAELLALVDVRAAWQREGEQGRGPCPAGAQLEVDRRAVQPPGVLEAGLRATVARDVPDDVVVGQHPGRWSSDRGMGSESGIDDPAQLNGVPWALQEIEVEGGVQAAV